MLLTSIHSFTQRYLLIASVLGHVLGVRNTGNKLQSLQKRSLQYSWKTVNNCNDDNNYSAKIAICNCILVGSIRNYKNGVSGTMGAYHVLGSILNPL